MTTYQTGSNVVVAYKVEGTYNTAPGTGSAKQLRINPSPGLSLKRTDIKSSEVRSSQLDTMSRLGSRMVTGSFNLDLSQGGADDIFEALMRSTWVAAATITQATASLASVSAPTSSTLVAGGGSWITAGVRAGDVLRMTGFATGADNSINLRVKSVTASTITVYGTPLTVDAAADTTFSITILKKLKNAATPTKRTFYVEQYYVDADVSQVFGGVKWISFKITGSPDGMATIEVSALGASGAPLATAASPYFISPTLTTGIPLVFADATVSYNGTDSAVATAFELTYTIAAKTEPVVGSSYSPDIFDNKATLSGSVSMIRSDLANMTLFNAETEFSLHVGLYEPESEPKDGTFLFVPRCKLTAVDAPLGGDGAMVETLPFTCGMSEGVTGVDDTLLTISSSAP